MAEQTPQRIDLLATGLVALFLTVIVTLLSLVFSAVSSLFKWYELVVGTIAVSASFTLIAVFVVQQVARPLRDYFSTVVERFHASSIITNSAWLISSDRLKEIERSTKAAHIWIITCSLEEEVRDDQFGEVVKYNLSRGVKYTYFIPNVPALMARVVKMKDKYNSSDLEFKMIDSPLFDVISSQDMAIFGPDGPGSSAMAGYMNLPIDAGGNDYFVVLGTTQSERIVGTLARTPCTIV